MPTLIGQALGGVLYVAWGPALLLLIDALSFVYAGIATWLIPRDQRGPGQVGSLRRAVQQYALDTRAGLASLQRRPGMLAVLGIFAGVNRLFMPVFVLLPFYTSEVLVAGPEWYGFFLSAAGAEGTDGVACSRRGSCRIYGTAPHSSGCVWAVSPRESCCSP